jgi:hypothetical protein
MAIYSRKACGINRPDPRIPAAATMKAKIQIADGTCDSPVAEARS